MNHGANVVDVPDRMLNLVLIEDHPIILQGLVQLLESEEKIGKLTHFPTTEQIDLQLKSESPDIIISDLMVPGPEVFGVLRKAKETNPQLKIILFTAFLNESNLRQGLDLQVDGIISKEDDVAQLLFALKRVMKGEKFYSPSIARRLNEPSIAPQSSEMLARLTKREKEVLERIGQAKTTAIIADELALSTKTVDHHKASIMRKLNMHSQMKLMQFAIREGLVTY